MLAEGRVAVISVTAPRRLAIWVSPPGEVDGAGMLQPRLLLPPGDGPVQAVVADATGRWLFWAAAAPEGVTIRRWDAVNEVEAEPIRLSVPAVRLLAAEPRGDWLVAVTSEMAVWAIDLTSRQPPREVLRDTRPVDGVAFRPDGGELAVAVGDTVFVFAVGIWERVRQFTSPTPATGLAFSPNGRRLATVGDEGVVTLLDSATGKSLFQLHSLGQPRVQDVSHNACVAFSADGVWLISANWDGTFNLWDGSPVQDP
jgi:WD40 repeat protein